MRCAIVTCPNCASECLAILETRPPHFQMRAPIDVDDVRDAHEILARRDWHVGELFAAA